MLIQATSWSDATQRPSLLYGGREEGLGVKQCVYTVHTVYMCVSKHWQTQTSTTI